MIELAEEALSEWMSFLLGSAPSGGSGNIFQVLFGDGAFSLTIALERPPGLPASARGVLAVSITVGSEVSLSFAVEVKVERRNAPEVDALIVDFENGVHELELVIPGGFLGGLAAAVLEDQFADFLASLETVPAGSAEGKQKGEGIPLLGSSIIDEAEVQGRRLLRVRERRRVHPGRR